MSALASVDSNKSLRAGGITVVMPNRNHGHYIAAALEAICTQSRQPDHVVVVDDASEDNSRDVIAGFTRRHPFVELIANSVGRGTVPNINDWVARAGTEYIYCAGADDLILPGFLEKTAAALDAFPQAAFATGISGEMDEAGASLPTPLCLVPATEDRYLTPEQSLQRLMRYGSFGAGNTAIYRTAPLRAAGGFPAEFDAFSDGYLMQELALKYGSIFIPEVLGVWRRNTTGNAGRMARSLERTQAVLDLVLARMHAAGQSVFPDAYIVRFAARWRHAAALNFLQIGNFAMAARAAELSSREASLLRHLGGQWAARYLLLRLSPREIPALLRSKLLGGQ